MYFVTLVKSAGAYTAEPFELHGLASALIKEVKLTCITNNTSNRRLSAAVATGLALSGLMLVGAFTASASAAEHGGGHGGGRGGRNGGGERGGHGGGWSGGYYAAPPVVYGSPYDYPAPGYYPPPVVYGPGIGIVVPGIDVHIR
jgi:hypothetical protein